MSRNFPSVSWCWPQGGRETLLRAALHPDAEVARSELRTWLSQNDFDSLGFAEHRLLAAISDRHGSKIADLEQYPRIKGLQRQMWTQSRLRVHHILPELQQLSDSGIEIMLLKGAARIALHPDVQRARVHQDVDILVRGTQMQAAAVQLTKQGWRTVRGDTALAAIGRSETTRAINFQKLPWGDIDLHRIAYHGAQYDPILEDQLWHHALPAQYFGLNVKVPQPEERLAMTLSHGAWSPEAHSDWLVDAVDILARENVDWERLYEIGLGRDILDQMCVGLSWLNKGLGLSFPDQAVKVLSHRCRMVTLLIAKDPEQLSAPMRSLRGMCFAWGRRSSKTAPAKSRVKAPPLVLTMSKSCPLPQDGLRTQVPLAHSLKPGVYHLSASVVLHAPTCKRRFEFEINSDHANLARVRGFAWPNQKGGVRVKINTKITCNQTHDAIALLATPGKLLAPDCDQKSHTKYGQPYFMLEQMQITPISPVLYEPDIA